MRSLLLLALVACTMCCALPTAFASLQGGGVSDTRRGYGPGSRLSTQLLSTLKQYELVAISSAHLSPTHRRSIATGVTQPHLRSSHAAETRRLARRFSKKVALTFQSEKHATMPSVHLMSNERSGAAASPVPKQFSLRLKHASDLLHPSYSETEQVWRNGVRYPEEETIKRLSEIDHCYYGAESPSSSYIAAISTCHGGFKGFVRDGDTTWFIEPAHLHLEAGEVRRTLMSLRSRSEQGKRKSANLMALQDQRGTNDTDTSDGGTLGDEVDEDDEELHPSRLHMLYRAEDVRGDEQEYMCTVGASEEMKEEFRRTGRIPKGAHGVNTMGVHDHEHEHEHDGHEHAHDHSSHGSVHSDRAAGNSAYSTWLATLDPSFSSKALEERAAEQELARNNAASSSSSSSSSSSKWIGGAEFIVEHAPNPTALASDFSSDAFGVQVADAADDDHIAASRRSMLTQAVAPPMKYVEMLVVNDHARRLHRGDATLDSTKEIVNMVRQLYTNSTAMKPQITVVLIGQITWTHGDPYTVAQGQCSACLKNNGVSVDELLGAFNSWRRNPVNTAPYAFHDNGQLYSGYTFEEPTLGYAGMSSMCLLATSGGIQSMLNPSELYNAAIATHELGHNFGMNHDGQDNLCPKSGLIMNSQLGAVVPREFSSCSVTYLAKFFTSSYTQLMCLNNVPTAQYGAAECGNGFTEVGEQCDCGDSVSCQSTRSLDRCCNATTCMFVPGATCSARAGCCNADTCQVVPASEKKVCRPAASSCDIEEVCPGGGEQNCPDDRGFGPGKSCSAGAYGPGLCYLNACFSYLQQCRTSGANFPGAPFDICVQQARLNQGAYCSTLWCSSQPGQCTFFRQQGVLINMADGVPCPNEDGDYVRQCMGGQCVQAALLNVNFYWNTSGWSGCATCNEMQFQNITCVERETSASVPFELCSPESRPAEERFCINPDIGCYGESRNSDIIDIFGYVQFSRKMVIFATLGAGVGFLVLMGCCYQAVTFQGENEELPGLIGEDTAAAGGGVAKGISSNKWTEGALVTKGSPGEIEMQQQMGHGAGAAALSAGTGVDPATGSKKKKRKKKRRVQDMPAHVPEPV